MSRSGDAGWLDEVASLVTQAMGRGSSDLGEMADGVNREGKALRESASWAKRRAQEADASVSGRPGLLRVRKVPDVEYVLKPIEWARDVLGIAETTMRWSLLSEYALHEWDGTPDPLVVIAEMVARGLDVAVESGTGTGKTFTASWLPLWYLATREDALVITTAPKEGQLTTQLWREMGRHWRAFTVAYPQASRSKLRVRMADPLDAENERWAVLGWACGVDANTESATRAQGFHASNMLIVLEETPGIPMPVLNAFLNTAGSHRNHILALGNPDSTTDTLHTFATIPGVQLVRVSGLDTPNVVTGREVLPGAQSPKGIEKLTARWGHGTPMWSSRVRGICPQQSMDALLRREWLDAAASRWEEVYRDDEARRRFLGEQPGAGLGFDVAQSEHGDKAAVVRMLGGLVMSMKASQCPNATEYALGVWQEGLRERVDPRHMGCDSIGVGAAAINEWSRLAKAERERTGQSLRMPQAINSGLPPYEAGARAPDGSPWDWVPDAGEYYNLRAQMGWQLRIDLERGLIAMPKDEAVFLELVTIQYRVQMGKVRIEEKDQIRRRLGRSPNYYDALVIANWVRPRRGTGRPDNPIWESDDRDATALDGVGAVRPGRAQVLEWDAEAGESTYGHLLG